jgi:hypothetical protein
MTSDSPTPVAALDELAKEAGRLAGAALGGYDIRQLWSDEGCIRFRTRDGLEGDLQLVVNWDVTVRTQVSSGTNQNSQD